MAITHQLQDEFPGSAATIERLTKTNYAFERLAAAYDEVNREIWRIESQEKVTPDEVLETLKKRRILLKDDIAVHLAREQGRP